MFTTVWYGSSLPDVRERKCQNCSTLAPGESALCWWTSGAAFICQLRRAWWQQDPCHNFKSLAHFLKFVHYCVYHWAPRCSTLLQLLHSLSSLKRLLLVNMSTASSNHLFCHSFFNLVCTHCTACKPFKTTGDAPTRYLLCSLAAQIIAEILFAFAIAKSSRKHSALTLGSTTKSSSFKSAHAAVHTAAMPSYTTLEKVVQFYVFCVLIVTLSLISSSALVVFYLTVLSWRLRRLFLLSLFWFL